MVSKAIKESRGFLLGGWWQDLGKLRDWGRLPVSWNGVLVRRNKEYRHLYLGWLTWLEVGDLKSHRKDRRQNLNSLELLPERLCQKTGKMVRAK